MKAIKDMNLAECLEEVEMLYSSQSYGDPERLADRIHDLTRWIPVSERMPTAQDCTKIKYGQHLNVLAMDVFGDVRVTNYQLVTESYGYKAWQRITPPEGT
jgi:hypothetical protein